MADIINATVYLENTVDFVGILDTLGIVNNVVYTFSPYKRLTGTYSSKKIDIQRTSDYATDTLYTSDYDSNGNINSSELVTWSQGSDVLITKEYSEFSNSISLQNSVSSKPKIIESGIFLENGIKFDGINDVLSVDNYDEINFSGPVFTIYINFNNINTDTKNIINKSSQYRLRSTSSILQIYLNSTGISFIKSSVNQHKLIFTYYGTNANEVLLKNQSYSHVATFSTPLITGGIFYLGNSLCYIKSIIIFNSNEYANYDALSAVI